MPFWGLRRFSISPVGRYTTADTPEPLRCVSIERSSAAERGAPVTKKPDDLQAIAPVSEALSDDVAHSTSRE
jgi:hypothetical protein